MTYKTESGRTFATAFEVVKWAMRNGKHVGIYKGDKFVRRLV